MLPTDELKSHARYRSYIGRPSASLFMIGISSVAALGGLLFGYDTAVISGAIGLLQSHFALGASATGWAASSALAGCALGAAITSLCGDHMGRRNVLYISAVCFLISAVGTAVAHSIACFDIFRIIGGVGIGAASIASPLYISEISPKKWRGRFVALNQLAIVVGMVVIYAIDYWIQVGKTEVWNEAYGWRYMFCSGAVPSLLLLGLLFCVPETPRFLIMSGRSTEAKKVARHMGDDALEDMFEKRPSKPVSQGHLAKALWLGIILAILQQVTGINVFLYYAPEIFDHLSHSKNTSLLETVFVGITNIIFTIVAMALVDKVGRKPLLIGGSLGMGVCLVAIGQAAMRANTSVWLLIFVLGYIACFALSVGPVTWIVLSELFPAHRRAQNMATATFALWIANFAVSQTFPMLDQSRSLIRHFGHAFPYFAYACFCIFEAWFVQRCLPETKNRSLEEISEWWTS